jgi:uncharacterized membrane protein
VALLLAPLILFVVLRGVGRLGVKSLSTWRGAGRGTLAAMFVFAGVAHFTPVKHNMAAMIPAPLPRGLWVIYLTGVLEIAGAVGLLIPRLRRPAAACLAVLLLVMLPANVNAALSGMTLRGQPATPLWLRVPLQFFWIAALWWTSIRRDEKGESL